MEIPTKLSGYEQSILFFKHSHLHITQGRTYSRRQARVSYKLRRQAFGESNSGEQLPNRIRDTQCCRHDRPDRGSQTTHERTARIGSAYNPQPRPGMDARTAHNALPRTHIRAGTASHDGTGVYDDAVGTLRDQGL